MAESDQKRATPEANEGEGNKTAARRYNEAVRATVHAGKVEQNARAAARALNGSEGAELRRAEAEAKRRASTRKRP
jgi:hypothetical protein